MSTPRLRRSVAAIGTLALVTAACSSDQGASTAPTTTVVTRSTVPPTTAATTTTTTTDVTTTTSTTSTVPPTTAPPAPTGVPTVSAAPVFAGTDLDAWLYLGRWTGGSWERAFDEGGAPITPELADGAEVTISEIAQTPVAGTVGAPDVACPAVGADGEPTLGPVISPNAGVPDVPGFGYRAIAVAADWPTHPREAVEIDETIQAYADAGAAAFAGTGVETQAGEIDQTVVTDLDGDGDTEVLVVFGHEDERIEGQTSPPGGFSVLLLIDADTQAASEVVKSFTPLGADGEDGTTPPFDSYRVLDVADLNGDGIAEVAVHSWFPGGVSVAVYSYDGAILTEVLLAGCAS